MDTLHKKTLNVSRGLTYTYYTSPAKAQKPILLLCHGFPDCAAEWEDLITTHLVPAGYGVVAPDCLGYAGTSKPTDPSLYKWRLMTADIIEILDAEEVTKVVSLGHDWGSQLAQRVYNLHPDRVEGLVMVNVAYSPPSSHPFDLDGILALTKRLFGYSTFWYWKFFTAPDCAKILEKNLDSMFDVLHVPGEQWLDTLCQPDGLRDFVTQGKKADVQSYATDEMRNEWVKRMEKDGFEAPLCWYKSSVFGHQDGETDGVDPLVKVPALYVAFNQDFVCRKEQIGMAESAGLLPHLTKVELDGSHWGLLAKKKEFGNAIVDWLEKTYSGTK
ncbi:Alpha/Beta hydrolase protein [Delphinella strobiligena]|nr:Alpha/Beta hydrolase protein [Delphinella strobiligena]